MQTKSLLKQQKLPSLSKKLIDTKQYFATGGVGLDSSHYSAQRNLTTVSDTKPLTGSEIMRMLPVWDGHFKEASRIAI